jgi:hypothetical protein
MVTSMRMPDECERVEQWPSFADAFREIHRFILKAMDGNAAAANALFRKYLNGELPDELLRISQSWVQEERGAPLRPQGDPVGAAGPQASESLTPVRPVARRRQRAGTLRDYPPHFQGGNRASGSPEVVSVERKQTA